MTTPFSARIGLVLATAAILLAACGTPGSGSGRPTTAAEAATLALAQQPRFAGLTPRDPDLIGQSGWYEVADVADGWEVLVRLGWGDCPAGCISEHRWVYQVGRDGSVVLTHEEGDPLPEETGVQGTVLAGPTCPVVSDPSGPNCADRPVAGAVIIVQDATGAEVARVTSDAEGRFSVELAPGSYRLLPQPVEGLMGTAEPIEIGVELGEPMADLVIGYDTGIR